jgi:hypothetical protein
LINAWLWTTGNTKKQMESQSNKENHTTQILPKPCDVKQYTTKQTGEENNHAALNDPFWVTP